MLAEKPEDSNIPDIAPIENTGSAGDLTVEQQFSYITFARQVKAMSKEQAQNFAIDLYKQMMIKQNLFQELLKHKWNIEVPLELKQDV